MTQAFGFVQFEFTSAIGPVTGRYVVAPVSEPMPEEDAAGSELAVEGAETDAPPEPLPPPVGDQLFGHRRGPGTADVLVIRTLGVETAAPRRLLARKPQRAEGEDTIEPAPLCLATVIRGTEPHDDVAEADSWLTACIEDPAARDRVIAQGLRQLNMAVRAFRVGGGDPYLVEFTSEDPRSLRIGYGAAADVAEGRWTRAFSIPPSERRRESRAERLRPAEIAAALLAERLDFLEGEELLLVAHRELQQDRPQSAALAARAAMQLLRRELGPAGRALNAADKALEQCAADALQAPMTEEQQLELWEILRDAARVLDDWRDSVLTVVE